MSSDFDVENKNELSRQQRNVTLLILLLIMLLGAATRLYRLDSQSLWLDEIFSLLNAHTFADGGMKGLASRDHVAPLHSIILWLATSVGGDSPIVMRMPSVIAGILTVPMFYLLGIRLFGSRTVGLIAATLVAISPYAVWFGQEARMYALLLLCASTYVVVAWPTVERSLRAIEVVALTLVTTIGLYTHHYMILLSAAFGLLLLLRVGIAKARTWVWLATQLISFFAFCYWLLLTANIDDYAILSKPLIIFWAPYTLYTFVVGLSFGPSVREISHGWDSVRADPPCGPNRGHGTGDAGGGIYRIAQSASAGHTDCWYLVHNLDCRTDRTSHCRYFQDERQFQCALCHRLVSPGNPVAIRRRCRGLPESKDSYGTLASQGNSR